MTKKEVRDKEKCVSSVVKKRYCFHFYFLCCWSTKCSLKGYLWSMQRLCVTSDGSSCWMIYCDCANYLLLIIAVSCSTSQAICRTCIQPNWQRSIKKKEKNKKTPGKTPSQIYPYVHVSTCPSLDPILHPRKAQGNRTFSSAYWGSVNGYFKGMTWRILHPSAPSSL